MKITEKEAHELWDPILVDLSRRDKNCSYYNVFSQSRKRMGVSANEMLSEVEFIVNDFSDKGLIQLLSAPPEKKKHLGLGFDSVKFYFTEEFYKTLEIQKDTARKKQKFKSFYEGWFKPVLIVIIGMMIWYLISKLLGINDQ